MRIVALLLAFTATASAQNNVGNLTKQAMRQAIVGFTPVPEAERAELLKATADLLVKHVTFRPDGTASSYCTANNPRSLNEWKKLFVSHITAQTITEADRLNGVSKRYSVSFGCDAHRTWDTKTNSWSQWNSVGNLIFPTVVTLEWKKGVWTTAESFQLKFFTPGPGLSIAEPKRSGRDASLPPGMTRR